MRTVLEESTLCKSKQEQTRDEQVSIVRRVTSSPARPTLAKPSLARPKLTSAKTKFGQTKFGQTMFGPTKSDQNNFSQIGLCICCAPICAIPATTKQPGPPQPDRRPANTNSGVARRFWSP